MKISDRIRRSRESGTARIARIAAAREAAGERVLKLNVGEPDFGTPGFVKEAAHRAALEGETRYTDVAGTPALREAVAGRFRSANSIGCSAGDIIVGTGAKQLIFNALLASVDPGDEVIVPTPSWVSYPDMVLIAGGTPKTVPCGADTGYRITAAMLEAEIGPATRWLIINSPSNPTGAVHSAAELQELAEVLRRHPEVGVISDDIYERIVFGVEFATIAGIAPDLGGRTLTVNGVSKSMAMTGWRIGFAAGPPELIAAMTKLQGQSTTNASSIGQAAALAALRNVEESERFIEGCCAAYRRRRNLVHEALGGTSGLETAQPDGAFYHFVDCRNLIGKYLPDGRAISDDRDVCEFLLQHAGVALVPGAEFGGPGHFRLSFAVSDDVLAEACGRIKAAVEAIA